MRSRLSHKFTASLELAGVSWFSDSEEYLSHCDFTLVGSNDRRYAASASLWGNEVKFTPLPEFLSNYKV